MAPKRNLQEYSLAAKNAKQKGKEVLIEDIEEKVILKNEDSAINRKDVPESSSKMDSSSESEVEDDEEGLDIWEREARRMFPPKEETNEWRTWTTQELIILEMEYMAAMLDVVPDVEHEVEEQGPEVQFEVQFEEQFDAEKQEIEIQGIEETESAQIPQVDEEQDTDNTDIDPVATDVAPDAPVVADVVPEDPDVPAVPEDQPAVVDAQDAVADPSPIPPDNN